MAETTTTTTSVPFRSPAAAPPAEASARTANNQSNTPKDTTAQLRADTSVSDGPTPYVFGALEGKPYAVKFLDIDLYHADKDFPDVREAAKALDEYVIKQAKANGLADRHESYKEVVDALLKQIGKSPNEDPVKTLKRLSIAAGAMQRLNSAKLQPILSAKSMTPDEFEGVQA